MTRAIEFEPSPFGGGWLFANGDLARDYLAEIMDSDPAPLAPHGGREGWLVEPYEMQDVGEAVRLFVEGVTP